MSDPRLIPQSQFVTQDSPARVCLPVTDMLRHPFGKRDRQLLMGDALRVLGHHEGHCYVQSLKDGYLGFMPARAVGAEHPVTHRVHTRATHVYRDADMKSQELLNLPHGALIQVESRSERFAKTPLGHIPVTHLCPADTPVPDPVTTAKIYLGTPYLWGGNSTFGVDCSGLVQAALGAAGLPCPGDSDLQAQQLGRALPAQSAVQAGDLLFWKGHVAMAVDDQTLIHANAFHMACVYEPIQDAIQRIARQGDGPLTAHKRLEEFS